MKRITLTVAFVLLLASPAQGVRIWFSRTGVAEHKAIDGTPAEYFLQQNPEIQAGATDTTRLYVWGTLEDPLGNYMHLCLDVNVYLQAGEVSIVDSRFYNYYGTIYPQSLRWEIIEQGTLTPTQLDDVFMDIFLNGWGLSYRAGIAGDLQYDPQTLSMLLGYVDLELSPDAQGELFFGLGQYGFNSLGPLVDDIFFGWGDEPIVSPMNPYGQQSTLPDAYIVPEPATAALLVCVASALLRRRRRGDKVTK
jgi:hypothetical protein